MKIVDRDDRPEAEKLERLYHLPTEERPIAKEPATLTQNQRPLRTKLLEVLSVAVIGGACLLSNPGSQASLPSPLPGAIPTAMFTNTFTSAFPDFTEGHDPHDPATAAIVHRNMQTGHVNVEKSTITGIVDSKSMTSALYWTFALKNNADKDKEASVVIDVPHNSVVNRATLWINGVPQEAAFASNGQVQTAYDWVVVRHRDPLLVTQVGRDRIKIMAAPVTANGGTMKIRIGLVAPVQPDNGRYAVALPKIVESNLKFDGRQDVHITSTTPIHGFGRVDHADGYLLRANVDVGALKQAKIFLAEPQQHTVAARLTHALPGQFITASNASGRVNFDLVDAKPNCKILTNDDAANRLSSIWAHQEIERLASLGENAPACDLANKYRIISSVSGAVVLESDNDYAFNALNRDMYRVGSQQPVSQVFTGMAPMLQSATNGTIGPTLQGATNGTIGPQAGDATVITGVNTAGTIRVNNLAALEDAANGFVFGGKILGLLMAVGLACAAIFANGFKFEFRLSRTKSLALAAILALIAANLPAAVGWMVATAREANLLS